MLALLALPPLAEAGTVSTSMRSEVLGEDEEQTVHDLRYVAAPGEPNSVDIDIERDRNRLVVRDSAGVTPGKGCAPGPDAATVTCTFGRVDALGTVMISLGDGADRIGATEGSALTVIGGPGDDVLEPGAGAVQGGDGNDVVVGHVVDGGPGADVLRGTDNPDDRVTYADRTAGIRVDLDGEADDGEPGEGDRVDPTIEEVLGGMGDDQLVASTKGEATQQRAVRPHVLLAGGAGADLLVAGPAGARLRGGGGRDVVRGASGSDDITGGEDADQLDGGGGHDTLVGGPGRDRMRGGPGRDLLTGDLDGGDATTRDGERDLVTCGTAGQDGLSAPRAPGTATVDEADLVRGCTRVRRSGAGAPGILVLNRAPEGPTGVVRIVLGCSQDQTGGCRGSLSLLLGGEEALRRPLRMPAGSAALLTPRVPGRLLAAATECQDLMVTVLLRTRDTGGDSVTLRRRLQLGDADLGCDDGPPRSDGPAAGW